MHNLTVHGWHRCAVRAHWGAVVVRLRYVDVDVDVEVVGLVDI